VLFWSEKEPLAVLAEPSVLKKRADAPLAVLAEP